MPPKFAKGTNKHKTHEKQKMEEKNTGRETMEKISLTGRGALVSF